jgi:hypothetical protein
MGENESSVGSSGISGKMKGAVRRAERPRRSGRWGREGKTGGGDECKIEELKGGRKRRKEVQRARSGLLCRGDGGRDYKTVYWGARPETVKLT